jgi:pilus assembly protein CpaF
MSISDRIMRARQEAADRGETRPVVTAPVQPVDGLANLKINVHDQLFDRLGTRLFEAQSEEQLHSLVVAEITTLMEEDESPLTPRERQTLVRDIARDMMGLGPLERFLADETVTEVMVNGSGAIYVERNGVIERTDVRFLGDDHLRRVIDRIVTSIGRRIDESSPMVDARLEDGSRVNVIIPPLSLDGAILTIRKFAKDPLQIHDLLRLRTLTEPVAALLATTVECGFNVLVSGGTGTGKTTMLNVLSGFVPSEERIVTVEDAVELQLHQDHVIRLEARPPNIEGQGEITIRDLVRNSLRMRPDRIIVGEVRGPEALDMLQAMNTGHDGSLSTVHANAPRDALARIETMVLMAGFDLPARAIREQVASALDLIVHVDRFRDGSRRITHITEVVGMEGEIITLQDIFKHDYQHDTLEATGIRPAFTERLVERGGSLPAGLFGGPEVWGR